MAGSPAPSWTGTFRSTLTSTAALVAIAAFGLSACAEAETEAEAAADAYGEAVEEAAADHGTATWSYAGDSGPTAWGSLSGEFATCGTGTAQSPIDIVTADLQSAELPPLEFSYGEATLSVADAGHGMKSTPSAAGAQLTIDGQTYSLLQFHVHAPSEHAVNGELYPLDLHFVHQNEAGELAVVGLFAEAGEASSAYAPIAAAMAAGGADAMVQLSDLLPEDRSYVTYPGSLTTPPCSEGVRWIVLPSPIQLSAEQIAAFAAGHAATNRPTQPLEGRVVRASS